MTTGRRLVDVACDVEIEQTGRYFHAHAAPEGIDLRPGDVVFVHDAPASIAFGQSLSRTCRATVRRAGPLTRAWTRATSVFSLRHLYEVGFDAEESR